MGVVAEHLNPEPERRSATKPIVTRFVARHLWSAPDRTLAGAVGFQTRAYTRATVIVRAFYAVSVAWAVQSINQWPAYASRTEAQPLWPIAWWFDSVSIGVAVDAIFGAYVIASLIVLCFPDRRIARIAYAVSLLQYMAFINGFDKINHGMHAWLFVSTILVLLPKRPWSATRRTADRQYFLTVIWTVQTVVLLFYTITGVWKVYTAVTDFAAGTFSGFNIDGFAYIVAGWILQTSTETVLGEFFVAHPVLGWLMFLGTMYLETFSILIAFRPRLQRAWGVALVLFHVGTSLVMGFTFLENVVLVGLFLVCSPMIPDRISVKEAVLDLPLLHFGVRRFDAARRRWDSRVGAGG